MDITSNQLKKLSPLITSPSDIPSSKLSGRILHAISHLSHTISFTKDEDFELTPNDRDPALLSALSYINSQSDWNNVIVGWPGSVVNTSQESLPPLTEEIKTQIKKLYSTEATEYASEIYPVWLGHDCDQQKVLKYAKCVLWPVLHYFQNKSFVDGEKEEEWWSEYVRFNEAYADKIMEVYSPGDLVMIHDYQLFLVPKLLRLKLAANESVPTEAFITFYLHSPFPSSECFRCLAHREQLLEGMTGANLIVTQSYSYTRHLISCCARLSGMETGPKYISADGMHVTVDTIPIGINVQAFESQLSDTSFEKQLETQTSYYKSDEAYKGRKIIFGRERLDSGRGVLQKLYAIEILLKKYPQWANKLALVQFTLPARIDDESQSKELEKIEKKVKELNERYGTECKNGAPLIKHYMGPADRVKYYGAMLAADVGLITCERDGLNTAALEFVVGHHLKGTHSQLILSEFTGTASTLVDAVQVNPWDFAGVAQTIKKTLEKDDPENDAAVSERLYQTVTNNTVQHWFARLITRAGKYLSHHTKTHLTPQLDYQMIQKMYRNSSKRVFLFDYDGTLTSIVRDPAAAIASTELKDTLEKLCADPANVCWIISGRDSAFLDKQLGHIDKLGFSAEHGCFVKYPDSTWKNLAEQVDMSWQTEVRRVFQYYTDRTQGSSIEFKKAAITWHYRRADPDFGRIQAKACYDHLVQLFKDSDAVDIMAGKANIEVRPRQFNKGEIVKSIVTSETPDFSVCIGDDTTDEDMFEALNKTVNEENKDGLFTIKVGPAHKWTTAKWHLSDPATVVKMLESLV